MKLMFISDIHGSKKYLEQAIHIYQKDHFDRLVILGYVLYHGPRNPLPEGYDPKGVIELLNGYKNDIIAIRGNCDSEVDQMVLDFSVLNEVSRVILADVEFYMCHGHHLDEATMQRLRKGTVVCHGHTHIPVIEQNGDQIIFNPGSIALPKNDTPHTYGVYEEKSLKVLALDGTPYLSYEL